MIFTTRTMHMLASTSMAVIALLGATAAAAQASDPILQPATLPAGDAPKSDDIIVTGTHIPRDGAAAPSPVTVLGSDYLAARATTNIADALNELPSFRGSSTPASTGTSATTAGVNYVDLRGLGSNRTLLLVDGKRHVPTSVNGRVDLNLIPSILISRVEVVTGGASAIYGSDAVAGVVNLIYKHDFIGIEGELQSDVSQQGDAAGFQASLHVGKALLDDRLHIAAAGEAFQNSGVESAYTRDWGRREYYLLNNPTPGNGLATRIISANVHDSTMTPYGLITSGPLRGTQFTSTGQPTPFTYGTLVGSQYMVSGDGSGDNFLHDFWLVPRIDRQLASAQASFDVSDAFTFSTEFYYGRSHVHSQAISPFDFGSLTIRRTNAFLPTTIAAAMDAQGLTSFGYGRFSLDVGPNTSDNTTESYRFVAGAKGRFANWKWDAYYQYGRVDYLGLFLGVRNNARYLEAIDSVISPTTGAAICRSALTNPGTACRPYNPFGDMASAESKAYVTGNQFYKQLSQQHVGAFNINGQPVDLWAGPLSLSIGGEYRSESVVATSDPLGQANAYAAGNYKPIRGSFDVAEGYLETELPVLRNSAIGRAIDLNGAVRYAHYSTSGGATTWKVGGTWEVIDGLRLRVTRSRDVRAPNISELFASSVTRITSVTDPKNGNAIVFLPTVTSGNSQLRPEKADTFTVGVTYTPTWARRLRLSVDYYDISIKDAISSLTAQNIVDRCSAGDSSLCNLVIRSGGALTQININQINIADFSTSGIDFEASYAVPLAGGTLSWRNLATYVRTFQQSTGGIVSELAGQYNGAGLPHWTGNSTLQYAHGPLTTSLTARILGGAKFDNLFKEGVDINDNSVSGRVYLNLGVQYDVWKGAGDRKVEIFGVVNNLLDSDPSIAPQTTISTNPAYFDTVGRAFRVGVRFRR